jgi:uncharacterized protein YbaP (TraB family)
LISILFFTTACLQEKQESSIPNPERVTTETSEDNQKVNMSDGKEDLEQTTEVKDIKDEKVEGSKGFLWETSKGNTKVYLLGSVHVAKKDMYPLREEILEAFESSDYLAVEADPTNYNTDEAHKIFDQNKEYTDGTTLKDHISPELYSKLDEVLQSFHLSAEQYDRFKPWYVQMMLERKQIQELMYEEELGIDYFFLTNVTGTMEILELEGAILQVDYISDLPEDIQKYLLKYTVENMDKNERNIAQIMNIWNTGDIQGLERIIDDSNDGTKEAEQYYKILLDDRNVAMVEKIEGFLNSQDGKTYFVVVGAGHYVGEMGIINLLQEKGYEVTRR